MNKEYIAVSRISIKNLFSRPNAIEALLGVHFSDGLRLSLILCF